MSLDLFGATTVAFKKINIAVYLYVVGSSRHLTSVLITNSPNVSEGNGTDEVLSSCKETLVFANALAVVLLFT